MDQTIIIVSILAALLYRWSISLFPYSGYNKAPMFGDFEAQRHWMEITYNLPVEDWYMNTTDNDLNYWGLDYPPLTAYHSYIMGHISAYVNSSWVQLHTSRGLEDPKHELFMRYTALFGELIYIPAVVAYFLLTSQPQNYCARDMLSVLLYPGLVLVDHGHFQYNMISLGLALVAVLCLCKGYDYSGSLAFCLALNYKQMELYHALPVFCYLLGKCLKMPAFKCLRSFCGLAFVVLATFVVCWYPFLRQPETLVQAIQRLFPFARGLFEDKVANFWCSLTVLVKVKQIFDVSTLARFSLLATLLGLAPSCYNLLTHPSPARLRLTLVNAALVFFLFSFQVHEKSILLAALPVCLLISDYPLVSTWFLLISTFSMYPLMLRDGLTIPFFASQLVFFLLTLRHGQRKLSSSSSNENYLSTIISIAFHGSMTAATVLCTAHTFLQPPGRYPDLFPVVNGLFCCGHFLSFLAYYHWAQFTLTDTTVTYTAKSPNPKAINYGRGRTQKKNV